MSEPSTHAIEPQPLAIEASAGSALLVGDAPAVGASGADLVAAAFVFVLRGDVADAFMKTARRCRCPGPVRAQRPRQRGR